MKKNGFTLVEMLGVIIILAFLMSIVLPNLINFIKEKNEDADEMNRKLIYNAVELYIDDNKSDFPKVEGNSYCITLETLTTADYLKSPIKFSDSDVDVTKLKTVQVTYQDKYTYSIVDNDDCIEIISEN